MDWVGDVVGAGAFGSGGSGASVSSGVHCGGGAGYYGGGSTYCSGGGGSGFVSKAILKKANTCTSMHTGNGECLIMSISE